MSSCPKLTRCCPLSDPAQGFNQCSVFFHAGLLRSWCLPDPRCQGVRTEGGSDQSCQNMIRKELAVAGALRQHRHGEAERSGCQQAGRQCLPLIDGSKNAAGRKQPAELEFMSHAHNQQSREGSRGDSHGAARAQSTTTPIAGHCCLAVAMRGASRRTASIALLASPNALMTS